MSPDQASSGPEAMRALVADYVHALHAAYLDHARGLAPAEAAQMPLAAAGEVTVIAAAARRLHLVATTDRLPPPQGPEVEVHDDDRGLRWTVRFYDPSVLPELGLAADDPVEIRRVLGIADAIYHLAVDVGGGLGAHHAQHSGVALANQHGKSVRDLERIRRALPTQARTVDELGICVRNGLDRAAGLLAAELTRARVVPAPGTPAAACLDAVVADLTETA